MPATLTLLVGLPGSGKTTRARALRAQGALALSPDGWQLALVGHADPSREREVVEARMLELALAAVAAGRDAALDFGLWHRNERDAVRALAAVTGARVAVEALDVDDERQRERLAARAAADPSDTVPAASDLARWRAHYEPPAPEEERELGDEAVREGRAFAARRWPTLDVGPRRPLPSPVSPPVALPTAPPVAPPTLHLTVGLPGVGKTTVARAIAAEGALLLSPDAWLVPMLGDAVTERQRDTIEGLMVRLALDALGAGLDVVLDFGLWGRDERRALVALAATVGARVSIHVPDVDEAERRRRIAERYRTARHTTLAMTEEEIDAHVAIYQAPDAAERALVGVLAADVPLPAPPRRARDWEEEAVLRWPALALVL